MAFHVPNDRRIRSGSHGSDDSFGNRGAFAIKVSKGSGVMLFVIADDGQDPVGIATGWEHVSVHAVVKGKPRTPTWAEMARVKRIFWDDEDCVVQYHPPLSKYINVSNNTLHLWKRVGVEFEMPPLELV